MAPRDAYTVFCGSGFGTDPAYKEAANQVGAALARAKKTLVYGGGGGGLMGASAAGCLEAGGSVHGVSPAAFRGPGAASQVLDNAGSRNQQTIVGSMHERKMTMADNSDGFIVLPGGFGTLEEMFESVTWTQLGIHRKPVVALNVKEFYTPLRTFIEATISAGFISPVNRPFLIFVDEKPGIDWGEAALEAINDWEEKGAGGGAPYSLEWPENQRGELR